MGEGQAGCPSALKEETLFAFRHQRSEVTPNLAMVRGDASVQVTVMPRAALIE